MMSRSGLFLCRLHRSTRKGHSEVLVMNFENVVSVVLWSCSGLEASHSDTKYTHQCKIKPLVEWSALLGNLTKLYINFLSLSKTHEQRIPPENFLNCLQRDRRRCIFVLQLFVFSCLFAILAWLIPNWWIFLSSCVRKVFWCTLRGVWFLTLEPILNDKMCCEDIFDPV